MSGAYRAWRDMKYRCDNAKGADYERYGGRGITYDTRWAQFETFYEDMGDRPEGMSLDRIDNDGPYSKANCRWATAQTQRLNQDTSKRAPQKPRKDKGIPRGRYAPRPRWKVNQFTTAEDLLRRLAGRAA